MNHTTRFVCVLSLITVMLGACGGDDEAENPASAHHAGEECNPALGAEVCGVDGLVPSRLVCKAGTWQPLEACLEGATCVDAGAGKTLCASPAERDKGIVVAEGSCAPCTKDADCPEGQTCGGTLEGWALPADAWSCKTAADLEKAAKGVPVCDGDCDADGPSSLVAKNGACVCADPKFKGPACVQCADSKLVGPGCDQCVNPLYSAAACPAPLKLDFLWVIDHSPSMCQEQRQLAKGFKSMADALGAFGEGAVDAQMAVVTVQQAPDKTDVKVVGRFRHSPATAFPPNCYERVRTPCLNDAQCGAPAPYTFTDKGDASMCLSPPPNKLDVQAKSNQWQCKGPKAEDGSIKASKVANLNCSLNTYCEATCQKGAAGDKFCGDLFEGAVPANERTIQCSVPGGGAGLGGCIFQPDTSKCPKPEDLPPVLGQHELDRFACLATVGAAQTQESKFEGGFRSAWMALDPDGPNCDHDACVKALRSCCVGDQAWCKETNPAILDQNKMKCDSDKAQLCEHLTPFGHCKRQIAHCCQGPYDTACAQHRDTVKCEAEVALRCDKLKGKTDRVPQACQHTRLLRPDGYLVLIFVSDDDDCSVRLDVHPHVMGKGLWETCQRYNDAKQGNRALAEAECEVQRDKDAALYCPSDCLAGSQSKTPQGALKCADGCKPGSAEHKACVAEADKQMAALDATKVSTGISDWLPPVETFVAQFKKLKDDPDKIFVAAISGDTSLPGGGAGPPYTEAEQQQQHRDRVDYYRSSSADVAPGQAPYMCLGDRGEAGYGYRYAAMTEAFGDRGVFSNLCEGAGFGPALQRIAEQIGKDRGLKRPAKP